MRLVCFLLIFFTIQSINSTNAADGIGSQGFAQILPRINCRHIKTIWSKEDSSISKNVDYASCMKAMEASQASTTDFWPSPKSGELFDDYYKRIKIFASAFCEKLFNGAGAEPKQFNESGCALNQPNSATPITIKLWKLGEKQVIPDMFMVGSQCTELPLRSIKSMSNAEIFSVLSKTLGANSGWVEIKEKLLDEGFVTSPYEPDHLTYYNWIVSVDGEGPNSLLISPTTIEIYVGKKHIGHFNRKSCQYGVDDKSKDCADFNKYRDEKPTFGLCMEVGGIGP